MAAITTKDQERQAVEKIRKIVEGLGENSYVGTAMAGVLEVAEQNIEYDAAFSLKEEKEIAERREQEQTEITQKLKKELNDLNERYKQLAIQRKEERESMTKQLQEAKTLADRYRMPKEMYQSLWMEISEAEERAQRDMMDSAVLMSNYVGEKVVSPNIRDAARKFRKCRAKIGECKNLLEMLEEKYEEGVEKE